MRVGRESSKMKKSFAACVAAVLLLGLSSMAHSQDLEEAIEAEVDNLNGDAGASVEPRAEPEAAPSAEAHGVTEQTPAADSAQAKPAEQPAPPVAQGGGGDEPNVAFERRLFRISQNLKPVSSTRWAEMIGSRKEDVYVVQSGDTLWDLSQTLFGDGFYWSKLWAENGGVENPHRISKGQGIRFISGTEDAPPVVDVVSPQKAETIRMNTFKESKGRAPVYREQALKDIHPEDLQSRNAIEVDELVAKPEIPPAPPPRQVLKTLPNSFVEQRIKERKKYDITGLDAGKNRSLTVPATVVPNSYLADHEPTGVGTVKEIESMEKFAAVGDMVFVELRSPAQTGQTFTTLAVRGRVNDPNRPRDSYGPVVEVGGIISIVEAVNADKNIYRAAVVSAVNPVRAGSILSEKPLPKTNFTRQGTRLNIEARVVGGEFDDDRKLIGENSVVYLDKGSRDGISAGDILPVRSSRQKRREGTTLPDLKSSIGILKVVEVENSVSTAIVLEAKEEIVPGDRTGGKLPEGARPIQRSEDTLSEQ